MHYANVSTYKQPEIGHCVEIVTKAGDTLSSYEVINKYDDALLLLLRDGTTNQNKPLVMQETDIQTLNYYGSLYPAN